MLRCYLIIVPSNLKFESVMLPPIDVLGFFRMIFPCRDNFKSGSHQSQNVYFPIGQSEKLFVESVVTN